MVALSEVRSALALRQRKKGVTENVIVHQERALAARIQPAQSVRFDAVGPEETLDWIDALESVRDRLTSLESANRKNAQTMASSENNYNVATEDIKNYKAYVERRMMNFETVTSGLITTIENKLGCLEPRIAELENRLNLIGTELQSNEGKMYDTIKDAVQREMLRHPSMRHPPRPDFDLSTPPNQGTTNPLTRNPRDLEESAPVIGRVVSEGPEPVGMFR